MNGFPSEPVRKQSDLASTVDLCCNQYLTSMTVHARGAAAHGYFESYADWSNLTAASFLSEAGKQTPVFLRFSTVAGSRGSPDTVRDVHGYSLRLYTDEGNYGNYLAFFLVGVPLLMFPQTLLETMFLYSLSKMPCNFPTLSTQ